MFVAAQALSLDFFAAPEQEGAQRPSGTDSFRMTAKQRNQEPPYRFNRVLFSDCSPGDQIVAAKGADLSVGPFLPRHAWEGQASEARTKFLLIALTNARQGMEEEFERWYWDQHFPDGLRLPGCFAGRRYLLTENGLGPYRHLAIYLFENTDIERTLDTLARISGTPEMPGTPAISPVYEAWYAEPAG